MNRLPWRIAGVVLMGIAVMLFDPVSASPIHSLVVPLIMALAAWLMVQNAAAVLLGVTVLTAIHSDLQSADWVASRAYPALTLLSATGLGYIALQRFRARIEATREARWAARRGR